MNKQHAAAFCLKSCLHAGFSIRKGRREIAFQMDEATKRFMNKLDDQPSKTAVATNQIDTH